MTLNLIEFWWIFITVLSSWLSFTHALNLVCLQPGFIMMTPQLFINYKLKSVAHLPWRMLTYKALNTFIDDIFAFVIKMPTMYRLGCLRDDVIFFIFLYQVCSSHFLSLGKIKIIVRKFKLLLLLLLSLFVSLSLSSAGIISNHHY